MNKKVLVTGGLGYIGSHTVLELIEAGYEPFIVDNLSNSGTEVLERIEKISGKKPEFFEFDICDEIALKRFFDENKDINNVIHFAAYKAVGESVADPVKYYYNNLYALINLLRATSEKNINFVFSSSCTVYGNPDKLPIDENAEIKKAESPYGNTKQIGEEILSDTAKANKNLKVISLRYFNPIGAHMSGLLGESPRGIPQGLLPYLVQSVAGKLPPLKVFGTDYDTKDGTPVRDYIHVVDLARAHVSALNRLNQSDESYEVFNIGTGCGYTVLEVIKTFEEVTDKKVDYVLSERRAGDVEKIWADTTKAEKILGWRAQYTLMDMLKSAWLWEESQN